ncbi:MAG: RsmD family RNA methyltransferase [Planctomycetota bacterium]|jgi:16S rRNA (guanine966-N2)-methyltransferase
MKTELRIVAGSLRGRKLSVQVSEDMRPTPQMVREALFSILGNAVPNRLFVDIFAGTGVNGMEALSRGAKGAFFIERDFSLADAVLGHLKKFDLMKTAKLFRTDSYRWVSSFKAPREPINVFISPPFADLQKRPEVLVDAIAQLQERVAPDSVIVLQSERGSPIDERPEFASWERRTYGRNVLYLWQREEAVAPAAEEEAGRVE